MHLLHKESGMGAETHNEHRKVPGGRTVLVKCAASKTASRARAATQTKAEELERPAPARQAHSVTHFRGRPPPLSQPGISGA